MNRSTKENWNSLILLVEMSASLADEFSVHQQVFCVIEHLHSSWPKVD